ncbi:hypothetical protein FisN_28Hh084 [Fistulifera solaris]|uniref:Uncharacterized protein n=1 Tax=Fistulifera solaris TaxID=1519565 RepID=A0A1Z5KH68_FISSO|nr:hypothetical protein FisN_28Hh084 [Fistulifera solaris]|eukprot:GAX25609.1 hypothetical protein FisN_28Hh084 [Fistulifera solaris]
MVRDSVTYDAVKNVSTEPEELLKSLSYYVDGEWVYCGEEDGDNLTTSAFSSLNVVYGQQGRKKKLVHFQADSNTEGCNDHSSLEPLRFVPKSLLPIATSCKDHDTHCSNERQSKEPLSIPAGVELKRFSSQQAAQCLRNQRILMIGDSHMRNFWRAIMDVLVGNNQHDYHRWDGYQKWQDFPTNISWDEVDQFLPNAMYARMNDHSKIGVQGGCYFIPKGHRDMNVTGVGHYWSCLSARNINEARKDFDLRRLESNVTVVYNITIDASWCASSFRAGLDDRAEVRGEECRDARQIFTREKGEDKSYLQRLLSQNSYDTVIMGHHVHDSKAEADVRPCREELGKDLIKNAEKFASWATENNINLVWVTTVYLNNFGISSFPKT